MTDGPRYIDLIESMRWVAERELIFGLHVHVGLDSPDKAIACANGLRTYLPELLALSANSPVLAGAADRPRLHAREGLRAVPARRPAAGLRLLRGVRAARRARDQDELLRGLHLHLVGSAAASPPRDDRAARLRRADAHRVRRRDRGAHPEPRRDLRGRLRPRRAAATEPITLIAENKWRAARDGLNAKLIDFANDTERPAPEAIRALVERSRPAARGARLRAELDLVEAFLERGTGADEQLAIYEESRQPARGCQVARRGNGSTGLTAVRSVILL